MDRETFEKMLVCITGKTCSNSTNPHRPHPDCGICPFYAVFKEKCFSITREPIINAYWAGKVALIDGRLMEVLE